MPEQEEVDAEEKEKEMDELAKKVREDAPETQGESCLPRSGVARPDCGNRFTLPCLIAA